MKLVKQNKVILNVIQDLSRLPLSFLNGGFTLLEILVVVLIIGILGSIALPQYQRAVLKSRYSGMMPIAKALAEGNEVFFLEHGHYSENPADLMIAGRDKNQTEAYPNGTRVLMYDDDGLSYVRVMNDNVPNARYIVYQKHSANFPDTTQCEAADERANELCQALGGELIEEGNSSGEAEWTAYLLSGRYGSGDQLIPANGNNSGEGGEEPGSGDEPGENNEPQTPTCDLPTDEELAELQATARTNSGNNNLTVSAQCINGKWKYEWTGGKVYDTDYSSWIVLCSGDSAYECVGSEFKGQKIVCTASQENGCADSTFSGEDTYCSGSAANGCAGSTFSGKNAHCYGSAANACAGTNIQAGAYCYAGKSGGCDGAKYGTDPTGQRKGIGSCSGNFCPKGVPILGNWNETNGSYDIKWWLGGYCNPNAMVTGKCPAGSPKQGGGCWDGEGNQTSC